MHITHRGVNRGATFIDDEDFASYLQELDACARGQGIALHGDVPMTNHVHLLVSAEAGGAVWQNGVRFTYLSPMIWPADAPKTGSGSLIPFQ